MQNNMCVFGCLLRVIIYLLCVCTIWTGPLGVGGELFGAGRDPILLDNVECTGTESNLTECTHDTDHDCGHSEDVGVLCRGK